MLKDQGVKNNGLTCLEEINSEWVSRSRLQIHPPQQVLEARVVAEGIVSLLRFGGSHHLIKKPQQVFAHDLGHILTTVPSS